MKHIRLVVTISALSFFSYLCAQIIESSDIRDVLKYVHQKNKKTLIVFDIDNTLACTKRVLGSDQWFSYLFSKKLNEGMAVQDALDEVLPIYYAVHCAMPLVPVDPAAPALIKQLQEEHQPVMALTTRSVPLVTRTIEQLAGLFIDFSRNALYPHAIAFETKLPSCYKNGIIFSSDNNKGMLLLQFLTDAGLAFDQIVYVDDKLKHVNAVDTELKRAGISCIGIRYGYQDEHVAHFDSRVAEKQLNAFFNAIGLDSEKRRKKELTHFYHCLVNNNTEDARFKKFVKKLEHYRNRWA